MKDDNKKLMILVPFFILITATIYLQKSVLSAFMVFVVILYTMYMGIYFRGKNWILGYKKLIETDEVVKE